MRPIIVSIEGNIGSGKSTILKLLKNIKFEDFGIKNLNIRKIIFIPEPINDWNNIKDKNNETIISKFYNNLNKYSFSFQMMAYISRLSIIKKYIKENPECIFVTERTLFTDKNVFCKMLYDAGNMEEVEYQIYNKWFDEFNTIPIHSYIYIKSDATVCKDRINKRNRPGEDSITLEYLEKCNEYHNNWLTKINNSLIFDGNIDNSDEQEYQQNILNKILDYIKHITKDL